jgi:uncharacterized protein
MLNSPTAITAEECLAQLREDGPFPKDAVQAGVGYADVLAPHVLEVVNKARARVFLMPSEQRLFLCGIHVLAAVRDERLFRPLIEIFQMDEQVQLALFEWQPDSFTTRLLVSIYDGDDETLFNAIANAEAPENARWSMFNALIWLAWDGRIARDRVVAFLKKFESEPLANDDDFSWLGWQDAVAALGVTELQEALRRAWKKKEALREQHPQDRERVEAAISVHKEEGWQLEWFEECELAPIEDPFGPLSDLGRMGLPGRFCGLEQNICLTCGTEKLDENRHSTARNRRSTSPSSWSALPGNDLRAARDRILVHTGHS